MSTQYDDRRERLTPILGLVALTGCFLSTPSASQAATSHKVKIERGLITLDDHVHQQNAEDDRVISTAALADGYSRWTSVVAYYNPSQNGVYLVNVDGADVLTSGVTAADQPSTATIEAAIQAIIGAKTELHYAILGSVRVQRVTSTYTAPAIDLTPRPMGVRVDKKTTSTTGTAPA